MRTTQFFSQKWITNRALLAVILFGAIGLIIFTQSAFVSAKARCEAGKEFVFVPAGKYIAGSDRTERDYGYHLSALADNPLQVAQTEQELKRQGWFDQELSRQTLSLPGFCLQRNLVTNSEYQKFIRATGHRSPRISAAEYQKQGFLVHDYSEVLPYLWNGDRYPINTENHPVVLVSYDDAQAFAQWKGKQDRQIYRLPTAAEWEKAARGQDGRYFPWGNRWQDNATNWAKSGINGPSIIGTFPLSRSVYGAEDMAGNVFEFTSTLQNSQKQNSQKQNSQKISVLKGCSWDDSPGFCRAAYAHTRPINSRHILFGFRLVQE